MVAGSPQQSGKQRRHLRGLAHALRPLAQVGSGGLTPAFGEAVDRLLQDHELVKIRVPERAPVAPWLAGMWLATALDAAMVDLVGRCVLLYRPHPEKPRIVLPGAES